jgi:Na+/pantothenate symporter
MKLFGYDDWVSKVNLISFEGTVNPERIVPAVMLYQLATGMKGLLVVALMAAGISTFNNNVNWAGSFLCTKCVPALCQTQMPPIKRSSIPPGQQP